jgi:hypothetical protein
VTPEQFAKYGSPHLVRAYTVAVDGRPHRGGVLNRQGEGLSRTTT